MSKRHEIKVKVVNRLGLHARPAMELVDLAGTFTSTVTIIRDDQEVDGKSMPIQVERVSTSVRILGAIAETRMTLTFRNPHDRNLEGLALEGLVGLGARAPDRAAGDGHQVAEAKVP